MHDPIGQVIRAAADRYGVPAIEITRKSRAAPALHYRRDAAMYLARELGMATYREIGRRFGGRDHGAVLRACQRVRRNPLSIAAREAGILRDIIAKSSSAEGEAAVAAEHAEADQYQKLADAARAVSVASEALHLEFTSLAAQVEALVERVRPRGVL